MKPTFLPYSDRVNHRVYIKYGTIGSIYRFGLIRNLVISRNEIIDAPLCIHLFKNTVKYNERFLFSR